MGIEKFVNDWDALKTEAVGNSAQPKPLTPFVWYDELIGGIRQRTQCMELPDLLSYANNLLSTEPKFGTYNLLFDRDKQVHERVPSGAAYVLGLFLGDRDLKKRALQQLFTHSPEYAHDLASTVNDEEGLYFTSMGLIKLNPSSGRAWHTAIELRFADVIKLASWGDREPKYLGMHLQLYDKPIQMWVLDTMGIKGSDRAIALEYANPKLKAA